jgi:VIT1/CCC1 family predicted Fe2+/Mn2+ transporter
MQEQEVSSSDLLTDIVIGVSDGLIIPFALTTGLSRVFTDNTNIVLAGGIAAVLGAVAMGIAGFTAGRGEKHHYEHDANPIHKRIGLDKDTQDHIDAETEHDKEKWAAYLETYGLPKERPDVRTAGKTGLNISIAYLLGGAIPILPYIIISEPAKALTYAAVVTVFCLLLFGYFKAKITGQKPFGGALRLMLTGVLAALAAYYIAGIFA